VQAKHPVVLNPYTLLSKIPYNHEWFSVIDLKDEFWACPIDANSQDIFAFEWEDSPLSTQATVQVDGPSPGIYQLSLPLWPDFRTSLRKVHIRFPHVPPSICGQFTFVRG
jgi:hypothetical protein